MGLLSTASLALASALLLLPVAVVGQSSDVVCSSTYAWAKNSRGQSPCLVAAYLQGACTIRPWNVSALPSEDYHYVGPYADESDPCQCSTVTYSLISACGGCQGAEWIDWADWSFNCTRADTNIAEFAMPIPPGTSIPTWALLDVSRSTWNFTAARANALQGLPDIGAVPSSTSTPLPSSTAPSTTPRSSTTSASSDGSSGGSSNTSSSSGPPIGAIVGGVVGGIVGLGLLIVLAVVLLKKKQNNAYQANNDTFVGKQGGEMPPPPVPYTVPYSPAPQSAFIQNGNNGPYSATPLLAGQSAPPTPATQQYGYGPQGAYGGAPGSPAPSQPGGYGYGAASPPPQSEAYAGMAGSPPPQQPQQSYQGFTSPSPPQQQPGYGPQGDYGQQYNQGGYNPAQPQPGGYNTQTPVPYGGPTQF